MSELTPAQAAKAAAFAKKAKRANAATVAAMTAAVVPTGTVEACVTQETLDKFQEFLTQHAVASTMFAKVEVTVWRPAKTGNGFVASIQLMGLGRLNWVTLWRKTADSAVNVLPYQLKQKDDTTKDMPWLSGTALGLKGDAFKRLTSDAVSLCNQIAAVL
jgi:hypothetical protein